MTQLGHWVAAVGPLFSLFLLGRLGKNNAFTLSVVAQADLKRMAANLLP